MKAKQTITIAVGGKQEQLEAEYLTPAALEYWHAWLANATRMAHNPFVEFAEKVKSLPWELREAATREFVANLNFDVVPKIAMLETIRSLPAVKTLCVLVTQQDVITEENFAAAFPLLLPFIERQEFMVDSLEEANRLRAEVGKPPIGQSSGQSSVGQPAGGQPPNGG